MPDTAVAVVRCVDPPAAVTALLAALGPVPAGVPDAVRAQLGIGITMVRAFCDGDVGAFADRMARGGAALGFELAAGGPQPVVVLRPGDAAAARRWCGEHASGWRVRAHGDCLVLTRGDATAGAATGRWGTESFGEAAALQATIDLAPLRVAAGSQWPAWERLDGPARVLLAPIVHALGSGTRCSLALHAADGLRLCASIDASVRGSPLGALLPAVAPHAELSLPADGVASLRLDRSFTQLLRTPQQFLDPAQAVVAQSFLSIADGIDGASTSFVDDLLGGLVEPFVLHVLPPEPEADGPVPLLQLPGFALVAPLRTAAAGELVLQAARMLATIANVERQQRGRAMFLVRPMRTETGHGLVAEPGPWRGPGAVPLDLALSPTVWIERGYVVVASTHAAAMRVLQSPGEVPQSPSGDHLLVRGAPLAAWLAANRPVVELGRMLDEGEDRAAASRFFDLVQAVVAALHSVQWSLDVGDDVTRAELVLERAR